MRVLDRPLNGLVTAASDRRRIALGTVAVLALFVALFIGLDQASVESFGGNSDGATVVLEGVALAHGHLLLSGWDLSYDSFWSIDALAYGAVAVLFGLRSDLLHVVPALLACGFIAMGAVASVDRRRVLSAAVSLAVLLSVLGLPSRTLSFFLLQGPWHVGTSLWCLIAFIGLRRGRFDSGWTLAVVVLAAGLLGDLLTIPLGLVPCASAGVATIARRRSLRAGASTMLAPVAAVGLALSIRTITSRIGTFGIASSFTKAQPSEYAHNVHLALRWGAGLFGVGSIPFGPTNALTAVEAAPPSQLSAVLRALIAGVVLAAVLRAAWSTVHGMVLGSDRQPSDEASQRHLLDDLLLAAVGGGVVTFIYLCPNGNGDYARYLLPAVMFATVLGARVSGATVAEHRPRLGNLAVVSMAALLVLISADFAFELRAPDAPQPAVALGSFLSAHHLDVGVGDYWSSSLVTVVTDGKVTVRPVIATPSGDLDRYGRQSDASWYEGTNFQFLVFDTARPWRNVNATTAAVAFGPPDHTYAVGIYRVLVWTSGVQVSPVGYTRS